MLPKSLIKPMVSAMAIATCVTTGHMLFNAAIANAESLPGITFRWRGREGFNELSHVIDLSSAPNQWGRYRFQMSARDLKVAASQFTINIPDHFDGEFDKDKIEVRICSKAASFVSRAKCKAVPLDEATVDMAARQISIYPAAPVPAGTNVELVFSNVKNPRSPGMYQFNGLVEVPGDVPLLRMVGSWIISIDQG
ncbi:MAG: DUF2808 domain-containing protein [Synechococcales cyanobacterium CRU_2_2]|nr:DUF2808 domain-containing protein [Synechococcales cyanobacterium CRU_2_2]